MNVSNSGWFIDSFFDSKARNLLERRSQERHLWKMRGRIIWIRYQLSFLPEISCENLFTIFGKKSLHHVSYCFSRVRHNRGSIFTVLFSFTMTFSFSKLSRINQLFFLLYPAPCPCLISSLHSPHNTSFRLFGIPCLSCVSLTNTRKKLSAHHY